MELRSLEGYSLMAGLSGLASSPLDIVSHTLDEQSGMLVGFDSMGNMYGLDVLTGAMQLLLKAMLPLGISRIVREPDGRIVGYTATGEVYRFSAAELNGLGSIFRRVGNWAKEKADKIGDTGVGKVLRTVATPILAPAMVAQSLIKGESLKQAVSDSTSRLKEDAKATGDLFGKVIRFVNRFVNPATILLRNGWLISMKINLFGLAATLRWGYAPSYQYAFERTGISQADFDRVKEQVRKIEVIYWQSGGMEENMKKAILHGKGNRDGQVPRGDGLITTANDAIEAQTFLNEYDDAGNLVSQVAAVGADGTIRKVLDTPLVLPLPAALLPAANFNSQATQVQAMQARAAQAAFAPNTSGTTMFSRMQSFQNLRGLGEPVSTAAVATVSGAVAAVAAFLKPITELIAKGKKAVTDAKDLIAPYLPKKQGDIPEIPPIAPNGITPQGYAPQGITPQGSAPGNLPAPAPPKAETPIYQKPLFWVGTAAALGVVGTGVYLSNRKKPTLSGYERKDFSAASAPKPPKNSAVGGTASEKSVRKRKLSQLGIVPLS